MDKLPLLSIFQVFGIFSFKFNMKFKLYETNSSLQFYGRFLTLLIQTFNLFWFIFRQTNIFRNNITIKNTSFTIWITINLNRMLWIVLNISTMSQIIFQMKDVCQLLNANKTWTNSLINKKLNEKHCNRIKLIWNLYLYPIIIISAINAYLSYGPTKIGLFSLFSHYLIFCQFFICQLFELMIIENIITHFEVLQFKASRGTIKSFIERLSNRLKVSKRAVKLFQLNKYVSIVLVQVICSFYFFVYCDMIAKRSAINYFRLLNWQLVLSIVPVVCHSWHRLFKEVRNLFLRGLQ